MKKKDSFEEIFVEEKKLRNNNVFVFYFDCCKNSRKIIVCNALSLFNFCYCLQFILFQPIFKSSVCAIRRLIHLQFTSTSYDYKLDFLIIEIQSTLFFSFAFLEVVTQKSQAWRLARITRSHFKVNLETSLCKFSCSNVTISLVCQLKRESVVNH